MALTAALLTASAPRTLLSWKNPNCSGARFTNVLVRALNGKAENRAEFGDELVAAIARPGIQATQSYVCLARPNATPIDLNDLKTVVPEQKVDAIVVTRLTNEPYVPGQVYNRHPYYGSLAVYMERRIPCFIPPEKRSAQVETNLDFTEKPNCELVWTRTTNTFNPNSPPKMIRDLIKFVIKCPRPTVLKYIPGREWELEGPAYPRTRA